MNQEIIARYDRAGWFKRRRMDAGLAMYIVALYLMFGVAVAIKRVQQARRRFRQ